MSHTIPTMKGHMGNTDYYLLSMKVNELVTLVREPAHMPGWDNEKIEEIYQRAINYSRVCKQIVPYLVNNESRFFGSFIVAALNFKEEVIFTPLSQIPGVSEGKLMPAHKEAAGKIGMLTIGGGVMMVPLDGQHRLKALDFAMRGKDQKGNDIPGIKMKPELGEEDVSVILVAYDPQTSRRIFTKVNRYARRPTTAETFVTDDDDLYAVLARRLANQIGGRLVAYKSSILSSRAQQFTTLTILYVCCKNIVRESLPKGTIEQAEKLDEQAVKSCEQAVQNVWNKLIKQIDVFRDATSASDEGGDALRIHIRKNNLLGKPVTHECLVSAYLELIKAPTNMGGDAACKRLNALPWEIESENLSKVWQNVLWQGGENGKVITKQRKIATDLIAYMAGATLTKNQEESLLEDYRKLFPEDQRASKHLPPKLEATQTD